MLDPKHQLQASFSNEWSVSTDEWTGRAVRLKTDTPFETHCEPSDPVAPPGVVGQSREAARRLGVTANRVRALIEAKRLKAIKVGREWRFIRKTLTPWRIESRGRSKSP